MQSRLNLTRGFAGQFVANDLFHTPDGGLDRARSHRHAQRRRAHRSRRAKAQPHPIDLGPASSPASTPIASRPAGSGSPTLAVTPYSFATPRNSAIPAPHFPHPTSRPQTSAPSRRNSCTGSPAPSPSKACSICPPDTGSSKSSSRRRCPRRPLRRMGRPQRSLRRLPHRPRLGRAAPQPARLFQLRSQICRGQQERPRRRRLPGRDGRRRLCSRPLPDRPRRSMALMGYSYGGEMAGFVEGKTDRFKAVISGAPVIDQFSEYGTEGGSWYDRWYFGKPWEHMNDAWRQSPLAGAAHAKTPFLLIQGESDTTDPARPGGGDVSRPAPGRRPRRTRHLSAREPRPARHRHARPPVARTLARLRRPPAHCQVHQRRVLVNSATIHSTDTAIKGSAEENCSTSDLMPG